MSQHKHYRACHLCEAICGLVIETEGDKILSIKGDKDDPLSRGHICPKAIALQDVHEDPDRLRKPIKRVTDENGDSRWQEIDWEEALDTTARALFEIGEKHGHDAVSFYLGNPSVHSYGMLLGGPGLYRLFRTSNRYSATSVDQLPMSMASLWLYGHQALHPTIDIERNHYLLMLGANPVASNGSGWCAPGVKSHIKRMQSRGGKLVVVDPRRTETAQIAKEHLFIRPGTDALFLLALLNHIFSEGLDNPKHLSPFVDGLELVAESIVDFTPEFAAVHTGIEAHDIRRIAQEFASAEAAVCYGRMGVCTQAYGGLCQWLIQLINIATGNLDKPGGAMFTNPAVDPLFTTKVAKRTPRFTSRVRGLPEFNLELPAVALAEEVLTPGEGQIKALFTSAGNPVLSVPNGKLLDRALEQLDFMVSLDIYVNETTRHADIILPPTSALERDHYDIPAYMLTIKNVARYNEALFDKPAGSLHDWEILSELSNRILKLRGAEPIDPLPPVQFLEMGLKMSHWEDHGLSVTKLKESPSGLELGPLVPGQLPGRLCTDDKRINCAAAEPLSDLHRVRSDFAKIEQGALRLIGRRHVRSNNSWMHNSHRLVKGKDRCTLLMHPQDMAERSIEDGSQVSIDSRVGSVQVKVEASVTMMPGVVSLPHGYGHNRKGIRLSVASEHAGVSANDITDERYIDRLSGTAAVNGVKVQVSAC